MLPGIPTTPEPCGNVGSQGAPVLAYTGIKIVQELSITSTIIIIMVLQYTFVVYFVNCYILVCNFVVTDISVLKSILVFKLKDTHVISN